MEIGTEISHKIRSAIKAKLVELGAYVDEELPDYIMVMVANKKSVAQMRDDLDLFLGGKTEVFTSWLHDLLQKLQSIGGVEQKEEGKQHKHKHRKRHSRESHDGESTSKHRREDVASEESNGSQKNDASASEIQVQTDIGDKEMSSVKDTDINDSSVVTETPADVTQKQTDPTKSEEPIEISENSPTVAVSIVVDESIKEDEIVPELLVRADTDEFTEELQLEEAKKTAKSEKQSQPKPKTPVSSSETPRVAVVRKDTVIPTREILDPQVDKQPVITHTESRSVVDTQIEKRSVINNQPEKRSVISRLGSKPDSRPRAIASPIRQVSSSSASERQKRRGPTSIVGNVIRTPEEEEEEEEYDPMNPAVGNVASVVKVTARKSSVPKSLQANKKLLMRAVSEAEKSLAMKKPSTSKPSASQLIVRPMRREEHVEDRSYQPEYKQPRLELTSKSRQNDMIRKMKYTIDNEPEQPKYVIRREEVYQPAYITRPLDNRVVEYIPQPVVIIKEEPDSGEDDVVEISPPEVQPSPIVLEEQYVRAKRTVKERPNPKFVVTLDGIDPEDFEENEAESDTSLPLQTPEIPINKLNPPKIQPFNIKLKDSDDEGEEEEEEEEDVEMTPLTQVKAKERCKFWPACVNGNACQYHHPTQPCKLFPQCKFSDKCLYIHPNCKYDAKCSRPDCPYTHATRRTPAVGLPQVLSLPHHQVLVSAPSSYHQSLVPSTTSTKKQCLYYPNCTNMNCSFYHPTPCRFGMACRNRFCTYFHPVPPTKDKLKWSKSTDTTVDKPKISPSSA